MGERIEIHHVVWLAVAALLALAALRGCGGGRGDGAAVQVGGQAAGTRAAGDRTAAGGRAQPRQLVVDVAGAVRRPGVVRVPAGSRVDAALTAAGGPTRRANVSAVNLAAPLQDGQQVLVPPRGGALAGAVGAGPGPTAGAGAAGAGGAAGARISLASATAEQLDSLDGIGPTLAKRIVEARARRGGFRSVDELGAVDGIGAKRLAALKKALVP